MIRISIGSQSILSARSMRALIHLAFLALLMHLSPILRIAHSNAPFSQFCEFAHSNAPFSTFFVTKLFFLQKKFQPHQFQDSAASRDLIVWELYSQQL